MQGYYLADLSPELFRGRNKPMNASVVPWFVIYRVDFIYSAALFTLEDTLTNEAQSYRRTFHCSQYLKEKGKVRTPSAMPHNPLVPATM